MPLTGYVLKEEQSHYNTEFIPTDDIDINPNHPANQTGLQATVIDQLKRVGYKITSRSSADYGDDPTATVTTDAKDPVANQLEPEFTATVLRTDGFTDNDINQLHTTFEYTEPEGATEYEPAEDNPDFIKEQSTGLPVLPVRVDPEPDKTVTVTNRKLYRPKEAWTALGLTAPIYPQKKNSNKWFVPWPTLQPFGAVEPDGRHCTLGNIQKIRALNKQKIMQKVDLANRARVYFQQGGSRIP